MQLFLSTPESNQDADYLSPLIFKQRKSIDENGVVFQAGIDVPDDELIQEPQSASRKRTRVTAEEKKQELVHSAIILMASAATMNTAKSGVLFQISGKGAGAEVVIYSFRVSFVSHSQRYITHSSSTQIDRSYLAGKKLSLSPTLSVYQEDEALEDGNVENILVVNSKFLFTQSAYLELNANGNKPTAVNSEPKNKRPRSSRL